jgi:anti-sigma B factor antagonist
MTCSDTQPTTEVRRPRPHVAQVVLGGEHDLASAGELADTLASLPASCSHLIVDLSRVEFVDSSTIRALLKARTRFDEDGRRFNVVVGRAPIVEQALELTGVLPGLGPVSTLDEALASR